MSCRRYFRPDWRAVLPVGDVFQMTDHSRDADIDLIRSRIRAVPDFPQPGVLFRDITPMLADARAFEAAVDAMTAHFPHVDKVVAIESRGFLLGAPVALALHAGLVLVRKVGRLPGETVREDYALEYGSNTLEIHKDAITQGDRVLIVDDVLATGGTIRAAANLVTRLGGTVEGVSLLIELAFLEGRSRLADLNVETVLVY
jgi:adenine phosphoribosyltransferase